MNLLATKIIKKQRRIFFWIVYYILCPSFSISIFVNKKGLLPWYMRCDLVNKVLLVLLPFLICCLWCCCHCCWLGQDPGWDSARSPAPLPCLWSHHARTTPRWRYEYQYWCQKQQQNGCGLEKQSFFFNECYFQSHSFPELKMQSQCNLFFSIFVTHQK